MGGDVDAVLEADSTRTVSNPTSRSNSTTVTWSPSRPTNRWQREQ
jgi:hypothetical protein